MSVSNGQRANAQTFNDAFLSRTTNSDTVAIIGLNHPSSGGLIANAQQFINTLRTDVNSNDTDIANLFLQKENKSEKGVADGYASLDSSGKVPLSQIPEKFASIEGNWNASTNTPTLADGIGDLGEIYVVSVAGTQDLGSGSQTFDVGDWVIYNSANEWVKVINSTAVTSVNGQTGAVSLDLDDIVGVDLTTNPPVAGQALIYDGTDWVPGTGGGSGVGGISYVINPDAEIDAADHTLYDDGAVAEPVDGTGGTPSTLSITRSTLSANALRGDASFLLAKSAADGQGEGVHIGLNPIDPADRGKRLQVSFDYKNPTPGSNNYADGDIRAFVYDVDNSVLIGAVENDDGGDILRHEGDGFKFIGFFNATDSLNYRLLFHVTSTNALVWELAYDNVQLGPAGFVPVNTISGWKEYVPTFTGFGTVSSVQFYWRRIGDSIEIQGSFIAGSTSATTAAFSLPNSYSVSLSHITTEYGVGRLLRDATSASNETSVLAEDGQTELNFGIRGDNNRLVRATGAQVLDTGERGVVNIGPVKIQELTSGNIVSNTELTQQTIHVFAQNNNGAALTANVTNANWTEVIDESGAWNGTQFEALKDGWYEANGIFRITATAMTVIAYINGVVDRVVSTQLTAVNNPFSWKGYLNKGDLLSFRSDANVTLSANANHWISISSLPNFTSYGVLNPNTELKEAESVGLENYTITADQWGDLDSIELTPGEWDVDIQAAFFSNGATTTTNIAIGLGTVSGNTNPGNTGQDRMFNSKNTTSGRYDPINFFRKGITVTTPTTYYLKGLANGSITNLQIGYKISARRVK